MSKSKCKWCSDGIVFNEGCTKVIRRFICEIDEYDHEVGCNRNCSGYRKEKEEKRNEEH